MQAARIIVLGGARVAAGGAGLLALNLAAQPPAPVVVAAPAPAAPVVQTARVLVATENLPVGSRLTGEELEWRDWPEEGIAEGFILEEEEPNAREELQGAVVRLVSFAGEPVRRAKLVGSDERYMSSVLEQGKRAMAIGISTFNGAGGFILPNDRVDVIATMSLDGELAAEPEKTVTAQTVLSNVRVLAIDQTITESEEGGRVAIGETATLEVTAREAELLAYFRETAATLSLTLRSSADLTEQPATVYARRPHRNVTLIKDGALRVHTSKGLK